MAARISDRISGSTLANDEAIQAYEADGVTLVELVKVNASDQISIAADGQDVVIGGTVNGRNIATDGAKLDNIEASADVTDTANVVAALTAGTNITIAANGTIASTDTNTTYSIGDGGLTTNDFTNADHTKLDGIATGANNYTLPAGYATETYVGTQISNLVDSSPAALNTLNELAAAIGDDANFSTTVTNNIATKLPLAGGTLTGNLGVSGNILAGTATAAYAQTGWADNVVAGNPTGNGGITIVSSSASNGALYFSDGTVAANHYAGHILYRHSLETMIFGAGSTNLMYLSTAGLEVVGTIRNSTAPANYTHSVAANMVIGDSGSNGGLTIASSATAAGSIHFAKGSAGTDQYAGYLNYVHSTDIMNFGTSGAGRMDLGVTGLNVVGDVKASGAFTRTIPNGGYLEGTHTSLGTTASQTNPIYIIGSAYQPFATTLSNMYGVGFTHSNASFINFTGASGWGQYVASDGDARIWLGASNGVISSTGEHYVGANKVWHAGDAVVAASATNAVRFQSTSHNGTYYLVNNWDNAYWYITSNHSGGTRVDVADNLTAGAKTIAGNLTVGNTTNSNIYMTDTDEGYRTIHCNSNRIGFLTQVGYWGAYCNDNGAWICEAGLVSTVANNTMGYLTMTDGIRVEGTGITYPGATAAGGGANRIGFRWVSPYIKATISNSTVITIGAASDYRIKDTITNDIGDALSMLESLPTYNFYSKGEEAKTVYSGVLAHELEAIIPSLVTGEKDDPKQLQSVDYAGLTPFLIQALKQVTARLRAVEALLEIEPAELVVEDFVKVESPDFDWPEEEPDVGIPVK